ncbi:MAG: hypothetical protein AB7U63_06190 [Porticoccaceae bacterium]
MPTNSQQIQIYQSADGQAQLEIKLEQDTLWLTQAQIAELFQVKPQNITMHLKNVFDDGELQEATTCKDFLQVQTEGGREVKRNGNSTAWMLSYRLATVIQHFILLKADS